MFIIKNSWSFDYHRYVYVSIYVWRYFKKFMDNEIREDKFILVRNSLILLAWFFHNYILCKLFKDPLYFWISKFLHQNKFSFIFYELIGITTYVNNLILYLKECEASALFSLIWENRTKKIYYQPKNTLTYAQVLSFDRWENRSWKKGFVTYSEFLNYWFFFYFMYFF